MMDFFFFFAILKREALKFLPEADVGFYVPVSSNSRKTYKNSSIPVCKSGFNTQRISQQGEVILRNVTNLKGKEKTRESCNDFANFSEKYFLITITQRGDDFKRLLKPSTTF